VKILGEFLANLFGDSDICGIIYSDLKWGWYQDIYEYLGKQQERGDVTNHYTGQLGGYPVPVHRDSFRNWRMAAKLTGHLNI